MPPGRQRVDVAGSPSKLSRPRTMSMKNLKVMKKSKYRAVRTSCGLHEHASKKEAKVCGDLTLMAKGGAISDLRQQVRYGLHVYRFGPSPVPVLVTTYVADFVYKDLDSEVVLDVKGVKTPMYRLKKKMMKACWGIEVQEA